ncbi:RNA degradosome polyphosphate kinase [Lactobacillus intestinalis]|uniref:Polyphosphate kinase n=1 Tax=Lactobacillus intestinalis DSM 6629 TaxID=1423761 RepID=A0ABR5PMT4_9LACO|nr:RNA degradosome polyphosphate kinase [Lactobacillus intestinalis]KRM31706.1 polyphosphate kinase [Lactobacillus intestinalis DSM 6629]UTW41278.1 RNA degradosome polyphosphate kinase [Lactobacillus intestinalis]
MSDKLLKLEKQETKKYRKPEYYINRELSWMDFNDRVLEEARNKDNPLLDRVNFLGITQSNVDEFFMVRVASLHKLVAAGITSTDASGMTPQKQLDEINKKEHKEVEKRYSTYSRSLLPLLESNNIYIKNVEDLNEHQYEFIRRYFYDELYPVLTPMADDTNRPFPFIANDSLNIAVRLKDTENGNHDYATVRVPNIFKRLVKLPDAENSFVLLENIIKEFIWQLFDGYEVKEAATFRATRDMDLDVAERDTSDFLRSVQTQLKDREHGKVVRLEIDKNMGDKLRRRLFKKLKVSENEVYEINGPIDLTFLKKMLGAVQGHDDLRYKPFKGYVDPDLELSSDIFANIRKRDYLVQHPYDSFDTVLNFIKKAAHDDKVLAIKMTLYRVSGNSPIIKYLGQAAQAGKQVTVLVEVKARFDEQNNVHWARTLEQMGCHVIYGLKGLKTHTKITCVIRRDEDGIRRYLHLGTGNYNDVTAHFYTDMGLFTCRRDLGVDATNLFNMLSGYSKPPYFRQLRISPEHIREFINEKVDNEIAIAKAGRHAEIHMKMNSLSDPEIIAKLYQASHAGVKIHLIVRGICCLRTDIPGISDNIEVHSIVGRLLEHSRIYYFYNDGNDEIYLSSADMMKRNLNRRVETLFPVLQPDLKQRAIDIYNKMWEDNVKGRILHNDTYTMIDRRGKEAVNCQEFFIEQAQEKNEELKQRRKANARKIETFEVIRRQDNDLKLDEKKDNNG